MHRALTLPPNLRFPAAPAGAGGAALARRRALWRSASPRRRRPGKMASAVRAGRRLRQAVEGGELAGLPAGLRAELEAALASDGALVAFSLLRRLHAALREAGRPRRPWRDGPRPAGPPLTVASPTRRVPVVPTRAPGRQRDRPARGAGAAAGR